MHEARRAAVSVDQASPQPSPKPSASQKKKIRRANPELVCDVPSVGMIECIILPKRRITVACQWSPPPSDKDEELFRWFAIDGVCFHQQQALCGGKVVKILCDIEQLVGDGCPANDHHRLCLECPGHGFLFSLLTGDNLVARPQLVDGKMQVRSFKTVRGMQRPYSCEFVADEGLFVTPAIVDGSATSFASDNV